MIDGAALRALEFDRIVEVVRSFALTPLGATALGTLRPHTDARAIQTALTATTEGVAYLDVNAPLPLEGPDDLGDILAALAVEGRLLDARQLSGMATFLTSVGAASAAVARASGGPFPVLRALVDGCRSFEREVADIRAALDDQGEVVDDASPELQAIRDRLRKQRGRLRSMLESYLRGPETVKYLQEQIVTERNGRFVLVIRSQHRSAIPGIVHGSSGSGASLFLEPLSTVEINNDIVALEQDEAREVRAHPPGAGQRTAPTRPRSAAHPDRRHGPRLHPGAGECVGVVWRHRATVGSRTANRAPRRPASPADPGGPRSDARARR